MTKLRMLEEMGVTKWKRAKDEEEQEEIIRLALKNSRRKILLAHKHLVEGYADVDFVVYYLTGILRLF